MSSFYSPLRIRFITLLLSGTVLYFFANIQRVAIPGAVFNQLQQLYSCPAAGVTALGASFMYAYAVMQPLTGLLLDRFGSSRMLIVGGFVFTAGEFCFSRATSLPGACCAQVLAGIGGGTLYLTLLRDNMRVFRDKYNITLSAIILLGYAGGVTANAPYLLLINAVGLQNAFTLSAVCVFLFWIICLLLILPGKLQAERKQRTFSLREFLPVVKSSHNLKLYIFGALNFGLFYVLQTVIGKKFLQDFCAMPDLQAGWLFSTTGAVAASGGFLFALLGYLTNGKRQLFCRIAGICSITVFGTIFTLILLNIRNGMIYSGLLILLSATASLSTVLIPMLKESNPDSVIGKSISLLNFTFYLAVAALGNLTGSLLNCFTPQTQNGVSIFGRETWLTISALLFAASCVVAYYAFQLKETNRRQRHD